MLLPILVFGQSRTVKTQDRDKLKFEQFYNYLNEAYVDTLANDKLIESAIKQILSELDPHSTYISAEDMKSVDEEFDGSFSGVGVEFDVLNDTLTVVNVIVGGPAESVGVMANDKIVNVDGEDVIGIARTRVPKVLRGPKGTKVNIKVVRKGTKEPIQFRITRDDIPIYALDAAYNIDAKTGYIKVNRFSHTTMQEFNDAFRKLGKIDALILDLRGNGGGLMDQAIGMAEYFLPAGALIVYAEGKALPEAKFSARRNGKFAKGKLIVLIDSGSASASEIVAGAIQDWDRGVIIGRQSFGKGLIQRQIPLLDGSAVRLTIARYHTPTGRVIQRPFKNGQVEDYYIDHLKRAYDNNYADSLNQSAPEYKTLVTHRTVRGGGGISPDIHIAMDTTKNYTYWNGLSRAGLINEFVNVYLEKERTNIKKLYPRFENFADGFKVSDTMLSELEALGKTHGIEKTETANVTLPELKIHLKALIARKLWGTTEFYRVLNSENDEIFQQACKSLQDWENTEKLLH